VFIKKTSKSYKGKKYDNFLLVESVATPKGPRHKVICSLGALAPAPKEEWLAMARKLEAALAGQPSFIPDSDVDRIVRRVKSTYPRRSSVAPADQQIVEVRVDQVEVEEAKEAGAQYVAHQMWNRLGMDSVLTEAGLDEDARLLTQIMTINRLVAPSSEHAMPEWVRRTALADILNADCSKLNDDKLYRNLDELHPKREKIEQQIVERERALFNLEETIFLYDLTSTYFEGECEGNPKAKRGYSRDKRGDCKQVVMGLVLDGDGFSKAHEVFDGNRVDTTTVEDMLTALEKRVGKKEGATVIVDRGMAYEKNLKQIKDHGYHYIVGGLQTERFEHLEEFASQQGWEKVERGGEKKKPVVEIKISRGEDGETHLLCKSEGRKQKDRAIRDKQDQAILADLKKLQDRIAKGSLVDPNKINRAIGRLQERYSRVGRYYTIDYKAGDEGGLTWTENQEKKSQIEKLDGGYVIKTDRTDMTADQIWKTYTLLTRVESAFRTMKSPLMERPIFHQLAKRVEAHIFLCVLAFHLLVCIERMFLEEGIHTSWETIRNQLASHQIVTVVLPASNGDVLKIRRPTRPDQIHKDIYKTLRLPESIIEPIKKWLPASH